MKGLAKLDAYNTSRSGIVSPSCCKDLCSQRVRVAFSNIEKFCSFIDKSSNMHRVGYGWEIQQLRGYQDLICWYEEWENRKDRSDWQKRKRCYWFWASILFFYRGCHDAGSREDSSENMNQTRWSIMHKANGSDLLALCDVVRWAAVTTLTKPIWNLNLHGGGGANWAGSSTFLF